MLFKNILEEFICEIKLRNYSKRTIENYFNDMNLFFSYLKENYNLIELEEIILLTG